MGLPEAVLREGRPWDTGDGRAEASAKSLAGGLPRNLLHIEQIERKEIKGRVISIAAIAEENDSLGRKPGEYLWDDPAYRVSKVYGDRYGGEWPREQFTKRGVFYEPAEKPKSELYRDLLPLINSGAVDLLDNERLKQQLIMLQRRTSRGGKDSIHHPPGGHDDVANAVAGALVMTFKHPGVRGFNRKIEYPQLGIV